MALLPELAESAASGEKARIYAEMRRLGAVPMVALIFRHLATLPGGLEWVWSTIGPAWSSGLLQEAAWKIAREAPLEAIAPIPREALVALGVDDAGLQEIRVVARAYNLANPVNLLTITCLARVLGGATASASVETRSWTPPATPEPLVAMTDPAAMSPEVSALLDLVAAPGSANGPRVVQSLYRHFGHRPQFLALLVTIVLPRFRDGSIDRSAHAIRFSMDHAAVAIVPTLDAPPAPDPGIATAFERFRFVIPQMIVVGALLEAALTHSGSGPH